MVLMSPEVLLSIVVLSLVLYGINLSTFKASIGGLLIIGIVISFGFPMEISTTSVEESVALNVIHWTGGLLMVNSWIIISKIIIIIGSISILLLCTLPDNDIRTDRRHSGNPSIIPIGRPHPPLADGGSADGDPHPPKSPSALGRWGYHIPVRGCASPLGDPGGWGRSKTAAIRHPPSLKEGGIWDGFTSSPILILIVALSSLLLVSSVNWLSIYLAIELQTLTLFILAALKRDSAYSTEAGLKYFVLGAVSSGVFLFGCALLYGLTGETSIQGINSILTADVGKILITISLLFKLSAAPFHMWAPDVYDGAPTTTTALLAIVPKVGVFSILVQIGPITNVVLLCAIFSIIYGAIGALNQTKIKRLLAYSGIGHIGFILFGVAIGSFESIQASLIYLIIYVIMSICSFSIILSLKLTKDLIIEVSGLSRDNPVMALTLALTLLSTAGVPPLAGFLSKWLILLSGVSNGYYLTCIVAVVSSVIAGVYYVRLVQIIYFQADYSILIWQKVLKKEERVDLSKSFLIGLSFFLILFLMISPNFLLQITHDATISLYM